MKISINSTDTPAIVKKYLSKYGLDNWLLELKGEKKFEIAIVIPAIEELENIPHLLNSLSLNNSEYLNRTIIVFVVNNMPNSSERTKIDNSKSIEMLRKLIIEHAEKVSKNGLNIAVVDASSKGFELPEQDGGVGLARKIGLDLALTVFDYNSLRKKILVWLDADCKASSSYIKEVYEAFNNRILSAATVNFEHCIPKDEENALAIICYEIFLRYYVLGLKYARSPYAFHTIGSTIACDYESYIKVEGMNKRKAAEDFYFLEKLAKNGTIQKIDSTTVYPSTRPSWRVPFGTGQRVNRFLTHSHDEYLLYSPKSFSVLKSWLEIFLPESNLTSAEYLKLAEEIHQTLYEFLIENKFEKNWQRILKNSKTSAQVQRQKILWFDNFKTLKLIHYLRDNTFPQESMFNALDIMFKDAGIKFKAEREAVKIPPIEIQLKYLKKLRELT